LMRRFSRVLALQKDLCGWTIATGGTETDATTAKTPCKWTGAIIAKKTDG